MSLKLRRPCTNEDCSNFRGWEFELDKKIIILNKREGDDVTKMLNSDYYGIILICLTCSQFLPMNNYRGEHESL